MSYSREQGYEYIRSEQQPPIAEVIEHIKENAKGKRLILDGLAVNTQDIVALQV